MTKDAGGHGSEKGGNTTAGGGAGLDEFLEKTKEAHGLDKLHVAKTRAGDLHLSMIAVAKDAQGKGSGSKAMKALTDYADQHGHRMTLTPDRVEGYGTSSTKRLTDFYKRHGFVENKGRNKDYSTSAGMIRDAKSKGAK